LKTLSCSSNCSFLHSKGRDLSNVFFGLRVLEGVSSLAGLAGGVLATMVCCGWFASLLFNITLVVLLQFYSVLSSIVQYCSVLFSIIVLCFSKCSVLFSIVQYYGALLQ
jgi:membrane-anchored protein YejM (alkaline phosphatase superfamily)